MKPSPLFDHELFANCGQHCFICMVHKKKKKPCAECTGNCTGSIDRVAKCGVRICAGVKDNNFCKDCVKYPCSKLVKMDIAYAL